MKNLKRLLLGLLLSTFLIVGCNKEKIEPPLVDDNLVEYYIYTAGDLSNDINSYEVGYRSINHKLEYEKIESGGHLTLTFSKKIDYYGGMKPVLIITPSNGDAHIYCEVFIIKNNDTIVDQRYYIFDETIFE